MENASKALLIAGSILIVILLIAMGVRVFNSTQGTTDSVEGTMQTTEVAMFNNKFMQYIGNNKSKNDALNLVNMLIANNSTNSLKIGVTYKIQNVNGSEEYNKLSISDYSVDTLVSLQEYISKSSKIKYEIVIRNYTYKGYIQDITIRNDR